MQWNYQRHSQQFIDNWQFFALCLCLLGLGVFNITNINNCLKAPKNRCGVEDSVVLANSTSGVNSNVYAHTLNDYVVLISTYEGKISIKNLRENSPSLILKWAQLNEIYYLFNACSHKCNFDYWPHGPGNIQICNTYVSMRQSNLTFCFDVYNKVSGAFSESSIYYRDVISLLLNSRSLLEP